MILGHTQEMKFRRQGHWLVLIIIGLMLIGLLRQLLCLESLEGVVEAVIDGQTLRIGETRVRLHHIVVAPLDTQGGQAARDQLRAFALQQRVYCTICRRDGQAGVTGECRLADGIDLQQVMVTSGRARDCPAASGGVLAPFETEANREIPLPDRCRPWVRRGPFPPIR